MNVGYLTVAFVVFLAYFEPSAATASSSSNSLVYHGRILKPDGQPLEEEEVRFLIHIFGRNLADGKRCLLYQEEHDAVDMQNSMGAFELKIGEGTSLLPATLPGGLSRVFLNSPAHVQSNVLCDDGSTTYSADSTDRDREIEVQVFTSLGAIEIPPQKIRAVPWAMQAMEIGGYSAGYLLKLDSVMPQQFPTAAALFLKNSVELSGGTATGRLLNIATPLNSSDAANKAYVDSRVANAVPDGSITFEKISGNGCATGTLLTFNGTTWTCAPISVPNLDTSNITSGILPITRGGTSASSFAANKVIVSNTTGSALSTFSCPVNQTIKFDATGMVGCYPDTGLTSESDPNVQAWAKSTPTAAYFTTSGNVLSLANSGASAGTYTKVTVDNKGRVTSGTQMGAADLPQLGATSGQVLKWNGSSWAPANDEVGTISGSGTANRLARWGSASALNASGISDASNAVAITINSSENVAFTNQVTATAYYLTSDRRLKMDIETLDDSLEKVLKLRGVEFKWRNNGESEVGLIAQEVEKIFPELVETDASGRKSVKYSNLVAPLIESTKELHEENEQLREELIELKKEIKLIQDRLEPSDD